MAYARICKLRICECLFSVARGCTALVSTELLEKLGKTDEMPTYDAAAILHRVANALGRPQVADASGILEDAILALEEYETFKKEDSVQQLSRAVMTALEKEPQNSESFCWLLPILKESTDFSTSEERGAVLAALRNRLEACQEGPGSKPPSSSDRQFWVDFFAKYNAQDRKLFCDGVFVVWRHIAFRGRNPIVRAALELFHHEVGHSLLNYCDDTVVSRDVMTLYAQLINMDSVSADPSSEEFKASWLSAINFYMNYSQEGANLNVESAPLDRIISECMSQDRMALGAIWAEFQRISCDKDGIIANAKERVTFFVADLEKGEKSSDCGSEWCRLPHSGG